MFAVGHGVVRGTHVDHSVRRLLRAGRVHVAAAGAGDARIFARAAARTSRTATKLTGKNWGMPVDQKRYILVVFNILLLIVSSKDKVLQQYF